MNVVLLCKVNEVTAGIATYLLKRNHLVTRTDEKMPAEVLSTYDIGISYNYRHILKQDQIDAIKCGIINFHSGYLPNFRGANPNIWQMVYGFGGVTAHFIDSGVDTGPIVARVKLDPEWIDTGESYYYKLNKKLEELFYDTWPAIEACAANGIKVPALQQDSNEYMTYRVKDVETLDDMSSIAHIIRKLAARTFPPYKGCYIDTDKGRLYIEVKLRYDS